MKILSLFKKHTWQSLSLKLIISRKSVSVKIFTALLFQTLANLVLELLAPSPARSVKHAHKSASHWFFSFSFFSFFEEKSVVFYDSICWRDFCWLMPPRLYNWEKLAVPQKVFLDLCKQEPEPEVLESVLEGFENVQFLWFCFYFTAWWLLIIAFWLLTIIVRALM